MMGRLSTGPNLCKSKNPCQYAPARIPFAGLKIQPSDASPLQCRPYLFEKCRDFFLRIAGTQGFNRKIAAVT